MTELPRQRFVLDTSTFVTDDIRRDDEDMEAACLRLLDLIARSRLELGISCYMPPSIKSELSTILEGADADDEVFEKLDTWVVTKSPNRHDVEMPAATVYNFVDEMADRVNRGLRVAEDSVREAGEATDETVEGTEHITEVDEIVSSLRDRYRDALRKGVLDSREDFDLLVLAIEMEAGIVTEDTGIIAWSEDFGLRHLRGRKFPTLLEEYLDLSGNDGRSMDRRQGVSDDSAGELDDSQSE